MSNSNQTNTSSKSVGAGLLVAFTASLCCITPVFATLAGIGGIASSFSWMDPFRPYLIGLTILVLGFAWYQKFLPAGRHGRPRTQEEIDCACEDDERPSFWQSKKFLGIVTIFAVLMLAFPSYAHIFYFNGGNKTPAAIIEQDTTKTNKIVLDVKGMTCAGCEASIEHKIGSLEGIKSVDATYATNSTTVEYYPSKVGQGDIVDAINKTGYKVIEKSKDQ